MDLRKQFLTNNKCFGASIIAPRGIVVHSTGCNNVNLKRYIQPDDGLLGVNKNNNSWNRPGVNKCVHAMIGKDKNGDICTYQILPWENCSWGVGKGKKGSYNYAPTGYIQFEILEDNLCDSKYFNKVFHEAAELCAYLCIKYNLSVERVVSHHEAYLEGYGSNHADCDHWLKKYGKNMDWFRNCVRDIMNPFNEIVNPIVEHKSYTVVKGDNMSKIAKANGITLAKLKYLNPEVKAPLYIIKPGQVLRLE